MPAVFGELIATLETLLDNTRIELAKKGLDSNADSLAEGTFRDLSVSEAAFGGSPSAGQLGYHHGRAHQVISETITGVIADLRDFRDGMENAQKYLSDADLASAEGLSRGEAAVQSLTEANRFFAGDHHYDQGRNNQDTGRGDH